MTTGMRMSAATAMTSPPRLGVDHLGLLVVVKHHGNDKRRPNEEYRLHYP